MKLALTLAMLLVSASAAHAHATAEGRAGYYVTTTPRSVTMHFVYREQAPHVTRGDVYKFNSTTKKLKLERTAP